MAAAVKAIRARNRRRREAEERARRDSNEGESRRQNGELTTENIDGAGRLQQLGGSNCNSSQPLPAHPDSQPSVPRGRAARTELLPYQTQVRDFYQLQSVTMGVALLITINFIVNILEKEIDPSSMFGPQNGRPDGPTKFPDVWQGLEDFFNVAFLIELVINWYGSWFYAFWRSYWNIFDFIVVANGCINLSRTDLGPLSLLRMLRAFRVFRLFKRIKSLNKIVKAIGEAIPGVRNAFAIMLIFACIYAILAVEFFSTFGAQVHHTNHIARARPY